MKQAAAGGGSPAVLSALEGVERVLSEEGLARWADMNRLNGKKLDPLPQSPFEMTEAIAKAVLDMKKTGGR